MKLFLSIGISFVKKDKAFMIGIESGLVRIQGDK